MGPEHFKIIGKIGHGSFGHVYVAEKLNLKEDGTKVSTGKQYAMKILNKK